MDKKLNKYFNQFQEKPNLENLLNFFSVSTWDRIAFTRNNNGFKIYETTITQNFLYLIKNSIPSKKTNFHLFESINEKANGNDIEIFIETTKGFILFPTQAKIIYKNEKYGSLKHKVNRVYQIDNLIKYSKRIQGIPLYLTYNYCKESKELNYLKKISEDDIEIYGCSISKAEDIYYKYFNKSKIKALGFYDLFTSNLYPLKCFSNNILNCLNITNVEKIKFYSKEELLDNKHWNNLFPNIGLGYVHPFNLKNIKTINDNNINVFNPKFRILISKEINDFELPVYGLA